MKKLLEKKVNLLLHIANIDGKYDDSEKKVLAELLTENGVTMDFVNSVRQSQVDLSEVNKLPKKEELFFWIMTMIKADGSLHNDEITFAKVIAIRLGFDPSAVDHFTKLNLTDRNQFVSDLRSFRRA